MSLLLATFVVPLLAPRPDDPQADRARDDETRADIFRSVVEELTARQTASNRAALGLVIERYNERIERFKEKKDLDDDSDTELRLKVLDWEQEFVLELIDADEVPPIEGYQYVSRVVRLSTMMKREKTHRIAFLRWLRRTRLLLRKSFTKLRRRLPGEGGGPGATTRIIRDIQARASIHVIEKLKEMLPESEMQSEKISQLIREYERTVALLRGPAPSITAIARQAEPDLDAVRLGLRIELEQIQRAYEEGRLSRGAAQQMRKNVYLMQLDVEDYV